MADGHEHREYRMEELAKEAGIPVRTLRFYRERGLISPPRREGRIAWYDDHHLARLRTITGLLERGHTLTGIADLARTFESGRDVAEVLGLGEPTEETPVRLTPEQLADYFEGESTPENLAAAMELGYLGTDGDEIVHISRRLLEVSAELVREGSRSPPSSPPAAGSASTRTRWPTSSSRPCATTARSRNLPNCGRWHARWWTRNSPWPWTGGCAATRRGRGRRPGRALLRLWASGRPGGSCWYIDTLTLLAGS